MLDEKNKKKYKLCYNQIMKYEVQIKPRALKDCKSIDKKKLKLLFDKLDFLSDDLQGDVKKLTNFTPEYRLRVGDYRILFETENDKIIIYRIMHRKDVYK
jgi:mRNA interferase RelE/StbE